MGSHEVDSANEGGDGTDADRPSGRSDDWHPASWLEADRGRLRTGLRSYAHAFAGHLLPMRAALVFVLPAGVVAALLVVPFQLVARTALVNGRPSVLSAPPAAWITTGIVVLIVLLVMALGLAAAVLVGIGEDLGHRLTVGGVTREVLQRGGSILVLSLLAGLLYAGVAVGAVVLVVLGWPWVLVLLLAIAVGLLLAQPLLLAWPVALAEGRGPFAAMRRSMALTRGARLAWTIEIAVCVLVVPALLSRLVTWLAGMATAHLPARWQTLADSLVSGLAGALSLLLCAAAYAALFCRADGRGARDGSPAVDQARVGRVLRRAEQRGEWQWLPTSRAIAWPATVVVALLPWALGAGVLSLNPVGVPRWDQSVVSSDSSDFSSDPVQLPDHSAATVVSFQEHLYVRGCAADEKCALRTGLDRLSGSDAQVTGGGALAIVGWRIDPKQRRAPLGDLTPKRAQLVLLTCAQDALENQLDPGHVIETVGGTFFLNDVRAVMATRGKGLVVASAGLDSQDDHSRLRLVTCADPTCRSPHVVELGKIRWRTASDSGQTRALSVAVSPDGRAVVSVADPVSGQVVLVLCDDASCGTHQRVSVAPAALGGAELDDQYRQGAQVRVRADGRPVIVYKDAKSGAPYVYTCRDVRCTSGVRHRVGGPGWAQPAPSMALDATGRPMVLTYDLHRKNLVLVSCDTDDCSRRTQLPLARWDQGPGGVGLSVDDAGRPMFSWADNDPRHRYFGNDGPMRLAHCAQTRCGAS